MNLLGERLRIDEEIKAYEEVLEILYQNRSKIASQCNHEIRIINIEVEEGFHNARKQKDYCLLCGKHFYNKKIIPMYEYTKLAKSSIIRMVNYPNLNKKWGKNYRKEVEKVYLSIRKKFNLHSEKEIYAKLEEELKKMEEEA